MRIRLSRDARLVRFSSSDGLQLEGRLTLGEGGRAVVLYHPHPLYGGSMLAPVILTVEQTFREAGYTALAFNFRGVGGSEGLFGEGRAEVADVTGALEFLTETLGVLPPMLVVAGYSFGSVVGGRVAVTDPRVYLYLGIAPPVNGYDFGFLRSASCRIALVAGSHDAYCAPHRLEQFVVSLPGKFWLRILDTDHFFEGALEGLADACREIITWAGEAEPL
jgi:hypothetical protein